MPFSYQPGDEQLIAEAILSLPYEWRDVLLAEYLEAFPIGSAKHNAA